MNKRQLTKLGVPADCVNVAIRAVQSTVEYNRSVAKELRVKIDSAVKQTVEQPTARPSSTSTRFGRSWISRNVSSPFVCSSKRSNSTSRKGRSKGKRKSRRGADAPRRCPSSYATMAL